MRHPFEVCRVIVGFALIAMVYEWLRFRIFDKCLSDQSMDVFWLAFSFAP
jgi:hypothetical protein